VACHAKPGSGEKRVGGSLPESSYCLSIIDRSRYEIMREVREGKEVPRGYF